MRIALGLVALFCICRLVSAGAEYVSEWTTVKVTAYCPCEICCGKWAKYGKTASGRPSQLPGVAVDTAVFPHGTRFDIPGHGSWLLADDTGSAVTGLHLDVRVPTHAEAVKHGVKRLRVRCWRK